MKDFIEDKTNLKSLGLIVVPVGVGCWCFYVFLNELIQTMQSGNYQEWNILSVIYAMVGACFFFMAYQIHKGKLITNITRMVAFIATAMIMANVHDLSNLKYSVAYVAYLLIAFWIIGIEPKMFKAKGDGK